APETNPSIQQTPSGSIITGTEIVLTCSASGGNPLATLTWNCSGAKIRNTTEYIASYSVTFTVDKTFNNKMCTCSAIHPINSYRPRVQRTLIVYFKPLLDTTRFSSPEKITKSENDHLFITVSVNSNPRPIIKWTFLAQENNDFCNNSVLSSTIINVGLHSSSNISIDYLKKNQFGQYVFIATNVVGIFRRKFSVLEKDTTKRKPSRQAKVTLPQIEFPLLKIGPKLEWFKIKVIKPPADAFKHCITDTTKRKPSRQAKVTLPQIEFPLLKIGPKLEHIREFLGQTHKTQTNSNLIWILSWTFASQTIPPDRPPERQINRQIRPQERQIYRQIRPPHRQDHQTDRPTGKTPRQSHKQDHKTDTHKRPPDRHTNKTTKQAQTDKTIRQTASQTDSQTRPPDRQKRTPDRQKRPPYRQTDRQDHQTDRHTR
ncbi:Hypothetical predicted protein, partial [Mytilus galloprovincialis]